MVEQFVAHQPEQRTDDSTEGVHRAVEAENPAALGVVHIVDQQRVPRRAADALAEPVDDTTREHTRPRRGHRDDDLAERRHPVTGGDQRASREPVAQRARREFVSEAAPSATPSMAPTTDGGAPSTAVR